MYNETQSSQHVNSAHMWQWQWPGHMCKLPFPRSVWILTAHHTGPLFNMKLLCSYQQCLKLKKKKSLSNIFDNVWGIFHKCCNCDSLGGAFLTLAPSAGWSADEGCSSSSTTVTISSWISESHNFGAGCLCSPKQQIQDQCVGLAERGGNALRLLRYMCLHVHLSFWSSLHAAYFTWVDF